MDDKWYAFDCPVCGFSWFPSGNRKLDAQDGPIVSAFHEYYHMRVGEAEKKYNKDGKFILRLKEEMYYEFSKEQREYMLMNSKYERKYAETIEYYKIEFTRSVLTSGKLPDEWEYYNIAHDLQAFIWDVNLKHEHFYEYVFNRLKEIKKNSEISKYFGANGSLFFTRFFEEIKEKMEQQKKSTKNKNGYIYFVEFGLNEKFVKIGKTSNISERLSSHNAGMVNQRLLFSIKTSNMDKLEKNFHDYYKEKGKHFQREIFILDDKDLSELMHFNIPTEILDVIL